MSSEGYLLFGWLFGWVILVMMMFVFGYFPSSSESLVLVGAGL